MPYARSTSDILYFEELIFFFEVYMFVRLKGNSHLNYLVSILNN